MKKLTKIMSLALAAALTLTAVSAVPIGATSPDGSGEGTEGGYTLTIKNTGTETHSYAAYQIFKGTANTVTDTQKAQDTYAPTILSNIEWGDAVTPPLDDLVKDLIAEFERTVQYRDENETSGHRYENVYSAEIINFAKSNLTSMVDGITTYVTDASKVAEVLAKLSETDPGVGAKGVATVFARYVDSTKAITSFAENKTGETIESYSATIPTAGYYLVLDSDKDGIVLNIVGDTVAAAKSTENATVTKTPYSMADIDYEAIYNEIGYDYTDENADMTMEQYQKLMELAGRYSYSADDVVCFDINIDLPSNLAAYDTYTIVFEDTLANNLTLARLKDDFNYDTDVVNLENIVKITDDNTYRQLIKYIDTATIENKTEYLEGDDKVRYELTNSTPAILSESGMEYNETTKTLKITITLTKDNYATETFANGFIDFTYYAVVDGAVDYNQTENKAKITYSNNPAVSTSTGTDEDDVYLFQYQLTVNKKDEESKDLAGAYFLAYDYDYYSTLAEGAEPDITKAVSPVDASGNAISGAGADMAFIFKGLSEGVYVINEAATPDGYNTADDLVMVISDVKPTADDNTKADATITIYKYDDYAAWDGVASSATEPKAIAVYDTKTAADDPNAGTYTLTDGAVSYNLVNTKGSLLPSTGGMGTRVIYTLGGILVCAAAVLLVVRRRMRVD